MLQHHQSRAVASAAASSSSAPVASSGRRALLLSGLAAALSATAAARPASAAAPPRGATTPAEDVSQSELVQRLLERSNAPGVRERRSKERLEAYYDRVFGDGYFDVEVGQGAARGRGISDGTKGKIEAWQLAREARLAAAKGGAPSS